MSDELEFTKQLGIEDIGPVDGGWELQVELGPIHMSRARRAHGGFIFTLLDAAIGRAIMHELPPDKGCPTVEMKINYFRPCITGVLRARGEVVRMGRNLCYAEGEIHNEEGKLVARSTGTFFLSQGREQSPPTSD
jgi:acyl-CoA thioesterase